MSRLLSGLLLSLMALVGFGAGKAGGGTLKSVVHESKGFVSQTSLGGRLSNRGTNETTRSGDAAFLMAKIFDSPPPSPPPPPPSPPSDPNPQPDLVTGVRG